MTDKIVVLSTVETAEQARALALLLIERRLAGCVNIVSGVTSVYSWKGATEQTVPTGTCIFSKDVHFNRIPSHHQDQPRTVR